MGGPLGADLTGSDQGVDAGQLLVQRIGVSPERLEVPGVLCQLRPAERGGQFVVAVHPAQGVGVVVSRLLGAAGLALGFAFDLWVAGLVLVAVSVWFLEADELPPRLRRFGPWAAIAAGV